MDCFKSPFEIVEKDAKKRETVGVLSSARPDRDNEVVDQASLARVFPEFVEKSGIVVFNHGWSGAVGRVMNFMPAATEDDKSYVRVRYGKGYSIPTMFGQLSVDDIWEQIEQGLIRNHSFAFNADRQEGTNGEPSRLLVKDVFEVSVVTVPANRDAVFDVVKALGFDLECRKCKSGSSDFDLDAIAKRLDAARGVDAEQVMRLLDEVALGLRSSV